MRRKKGGHIRRLTNTGFILALIVFLVAASGLLIGRFNIKTERQTVRIKGLKPELAGFKIVQISDLHMACYFHHKELLSRVMDRIDQEHPDILLNTGDFITFGWREFDGYDSIYRIGSAKYGKFAILGNHDIGTYDPDFTKADIENNILLMKSKISASGYKVLTQEFTTVDVGNSRIALIGVVTRGSFPRIVHGDVNQAMSGLDSVDLKILMAHDPNQWITDVAGKTDIALTLSGHTHGMQIGIVTKRFRWSPAVFFYPRWNGLYSEGDQHLYVNRGLGVLAIPFRVGMPPEITVLTLQPDLN
jgi:predicted MPP superfamily phosphohydrolase